MTASFLKIFTSLPNSPNRIQWILSTQGFQFRERLPQVGHGNHFFSGLPGGLGDENREHPVPGNKADGQGFLHRRGIPRWEFRTNSRNCFTSG